MTSFFHPFTCMIAGPTKAGKTTFVKNIIQNRIALIDPPPKKIWWCFSEHQHAYDDLIDDVIFIKGLPDISLIKEHYPDPQLLILDDLMLELGQDKRLIELFTKGCHHWSISVIHIVQNLFFKGLRTSRINSEYLIIMKNPSDQLLPQILSRQLFPTRTKYFLDAYADATLEPYGYLFIDLSQKTPDKLRLKTNIFSDQPIFYVPRL